MHIYFCSAVKHSISHTNSNANRWHERSKRNGWLSWNSIGKPEPNFTTRTAAQQRWKALLHHPPRKQRSKLLPLLESATGFAGRERCLCGNFCVFLPCKFGSRWPRNLLLACSGVLQTDEIGRNINDGSTLAPFFWWRKYFSVNPTALCIVVHC